jgi:hypothetical protein
MFADIGADMDKRTVEDTEPEARKETDDEITPSTKTFTRKSLRNLPPV